MWNPAALSDLSHDTHADAQGAQTLPAYLLTLRELTALRKMLFIWYEIAVRYVVGALFCLAALEKLLRNVIPWKQLIFLAAGYALLYAALYFAGKHLLSRKTKIRITPELISVRKLFRWEDFDRSVEHQFVKIPHRKTDDEALKMQWDAQEAAQKGIVLRKKPIYGRTAHVALIYAGEVYFLLDVYDHGRANAVVRQLIHLDRELDAAMGKREAWSDSPVKANTPGGLQ